MFKKQLIAFGLMTSMMTGIGATSFAGVTANGRADLSNTQLTQDVSKKNPDCLPCLVVAVAAVVIAHYMGVKKNDAPAQISAHDVPEAAFDK